MKKLIEQKFTQELSALYLGVRVTSVTDKMKESEKGRYMIENVEFKFHEYEVFEEHNSYPVPTYEIVFTVTGTKRTENVTFHDIDKLPKIDDNFQSFGSLPINTNFFDHYSGESFTKISENSAVAISGGDAIEGEADNFALNDRVQPLFTE